MHRRLRVFYCCLFNLKFTFLRDLDGLLLIRVRVEEMV
jgi:hypothetical protein